MSNDTEGQSLPERLSLLLKDKYMGIGFHRTSAEGVFYLSLNSKVNAAFCRHLIFVPCLAVIISGSCCVKAAGRLYQACTGDFFLSFTCMPAQLELPDENDGECSALLLPLSGSFLRELYLQDIKENGAFSSKFIEPEAFIKGASDGELLGSIERLLRCEQSAGQNGVLLKLYLHEVYCMLFSAEAGDHIRNFFRNTGGSRDMLKISNYIFRELDCDMKMLSEISNVSQASVYRKFRRCLGMSPADYLRRIRLLWARLMLITDGNIRISDVSSSLGFSSQQYFSRVYSEFFGINPSKDQLCLCDNYTDILISFIVILTTLEEDSVRSAVADGQLLSNACYRDIRPVISV